MIQKTKIYLTMIYRKEFRIIEFIIILTIKFIESDLTQPLNDYSLNIEHKFKFHHFHISLMDQNTSLD